MIPGPFKEPPNLELLSREQLIDAVRQLTASLNKLAGMIDENHKMFERVSALIGPMVTSSSAPGAKSDGT